MGKKKKPVRKKKDSGNKAEIINLITAVINLIITLITLIIALSGK